MMGGFSILMLIFGIAIFLTGLYMYTGHKLGIMTYRAAFRNLTKSEWKNIGKWTVVSSLIPIILAILGIVFKW